MRKLPARRLLGSVIAAALMLPGTAYTLGLGEIEVNSALNQQLDAEIELLSASPEDVETLIVKLASREEFQRAGLDRPFMLNDLRFKATTEGGTPVITVSSASPVREPYLSFLVEIDWPNGHLLREYTVLLDPPVFMTQQAAPAVGQTAQASDGFRPGAPAPTNVVPVATMGTADSSRPAASGQAMPAPVQSQAQPQYQAAPTSQVAAPVFIAPQQSRNVNQPAGTYRIQAGDTAWSLADAMRPDQSVSVEQMMLAMLRTNPESFINENINGLKRGYILRIPDYDEIVAVNQEEARAMVREHAALWREYQQAAAGAAPMSAMEADGMTTSEGAAVDSAAGDEAYLEIVSAGGGTSLGGKDPTQMTAQELRAELALARERVETERVEKEALQQRVGVLEERVEKMKGMLSIEDSELAEMQSLAEGTEAVAGDEAAMDEPVDAEDLRALEESLEQAMTEDAAEETGAETDETMATDESLAESEMAGDEMTEEGEAVFLDEQAATEDVVEEEVEAVAEEPKPADVERRPPPIVKTEPADPLSRLLADPMLLGAAGGGLLLIAALITLMIKRRKAKSEADEEPLAPMAAGSDNLEDIADDIAQVAEADDEVKVDSLAGETVAETPEQTAEVDTESTMVLSSAEDTVVAEPSSEPATAEAEVRDDVIAEADVYLAYGIYQQAEELLTQSISDNPDRNDYRVKLAETHYASKNKDGFIAVATELQSRLDEDSPMWKKVVGMGQDLCAENPMFQGSMVGAPAVAGVAADEPSMDFDLGMEEAETAAVSEPGMDLSLDEPLELDAGEDSAAGQAAEAEAEVKEGADELAELEFDLTDTGAVEEDEAADEGFALDIDATELDIDTEDDTGVQATAAEEEAIDLGDLDLDIGEPEAAPADTEATAVLDDIATEPVTEQDDDEELAIDLTEESAELGMDFDLGEEEAKPAAESPVEEIAAEPAVEPVADMGDEGDDFDLSELDDVDEVSTKLDLARAYLDMGDHDGTRGILNEVLAEGNDAQKQEANELLAKLE